MPSIYTSWLPCVTDDAETRRKKLYLQLISVGEDLYCKGAHLAELNKEITHLEKEVAVMRAELKTLRGLDVNSNG